MTDIDEKRVLEKFIGRPMTDEQWALFKKVSDIVKKCPPGYEVKWLHVKNHQGIYVYCPEYVKKGEKSECN